VPSNPFPSHELIYCWTEPRFLSPNLIEYSIMPSRRNRLPLNTSSSYGPHEPTHSPPTKYAT
jgi:hypothetical protein